MEEPLGVPFPGHPWTEDNQLNWVGHFITKYCPEPRYVPSFPERYGKKVSSPSRKHPFQFCVGCSPGSEGAQAAWADCPFLVHDYAKGGDTVSGVSHQIRNIFLQGAGKKPEWAPWTSTETLFGKHIFSDYLSDFSDTFSNVGWNKRLQVSLFKLAHWIYVKI